MNNISPIKRVSAILFMLILNTVLGIGYLTAQTTYPVQANVYLAPPYSNYLSDYYSTSKEKLVVTLLNRDQQKPTVDVRLRVTITAVNGLKIQSKEEINYPTITLDAGIPFRLTQEYLAHYFLSRNVNTQGSFNQGKLPEGLIEFTFQAIEKHTGKVLSAPATGRVWLTSQKPPILRLPSNNEHIAFKEPLNLKFQWEPLHKNISQVEYLFELKELPNNGVAPQSAFLYAPLIYQERLVYTYLMYNIMMPPLDPNKTYAWRVQAIAKDGVDDLNMFVNNGYSEVYCFNTINSCDAPTNCTANLKDRSLTLSWTAPEEANEYVVQYRLKYGSDATWEEGNTYETQRTLYSLQRGAAYEFRVGSICTSGQPVFCEPGEITIPEVDSARLARCGIIGDFSLENKEPIEFLSGGDVVMVSDYPMTLTRVSGGNGSFSGEGWVPVNWLLETKWQVEFDNIQVNTDKQMIGGSVRAKYTEKESQIANLDEITKGAHENTREGIMIPDITLNIVIPPNPVFEYNPETGELTIYTTDGKTPVTTVNLKNEGKEAFPLTIKDADNNIYQVDTKKDAEGNPIINEDGKQELESTYLGKQEEPLADGSFNPKALSANSAVVTFEKGKGFYAFDKWQPIYKEIPVIRKEYDKLADDYYASWKFLPVGGSDKVTAVINIDSKNPADIVSDSIIFMTPQGVRFEAKKTGNNIYEITIAGGQDKDVQEIYALYPKKGSSSQFLTLGKLDVVTYQKQENRLVVVQVDATINGEGLDRKLNEIYNPAGVHWAVETQSFKPKNEDILKDFIDGKSGFLSAYNKNMKSLIAEFEAGNQVDSKASYIFLFRNNGVSAQNDNQRDATGFMPRGNRYGFIFTSKVSVYELDYIFAHELGHGRWRLTHTFDDYGKKMAKFSTDNLMDYADPNKSEDYKNKVHLAKWQWEQLNNPAWFTNPFDGDEKGMNKIISKIDTLFKNKDDKTVSFLTPATRIISLPLETLYNVEFQYGAIYTTNRNTQDNIYSSKLPVGTLSAFCIGTNDKDKACYRYSDDVGLYVNTITGEEYKYEIDKSLIDGFVYPAPCGAEYSLYKFPLNSGLQHYQNDKESRSSFVEFAKLFTPFSSQFMPIAKDGIILKQIITKQIYANCIYCMTENTAKMTQAHCEQPELIWIDKIAQMRNVFPEYFDKFTQKDKVKLNISTTLTGAIIDPKEIDGNWEIPVEHEYKTFDGDFTSIHYIKLNDYPWGKYLNANPVIKASYATNKIEYFKAFYTEFENYISTTTLEDDNFWETVSENTNVNDIIDQIKKEAVFQLQQAPLDKKKIAIKKIVDANSFFNTNTDYFIKLLVSLKNNQKKDVLKYIEENVGYQKIYNNFYNHNSWYAANGKDNLTGVLMVLSNMITSAGYYTTDEEQEGLFLDNINTIPELESDMFRFRNLNWDFTSKNNLKIGDAYSSIPYNQMISVRIAGSFKIGNTSLKKGNIIQVPAIQAALMSHINTVSVGEKSAWFAFDLGTLVIGVGEAKILLSSGNYIRKALVAFDLVGSTAGIVAQSLNEDAISPELRSKIQIASFIMVLPNVVKQIPRVKKVVNELDEVINAGLNVKKERLTQKELDELKKLRDELNARINTGGVTDDILNSFVNKLNARIKESNGFSLFHTNVEITHIISEGRKLGLTDDIIDDLLYISCRNDKPIDAIDLMRQMDNYVNVVLKRGYPYGFANKADFDLFRNQFIGGLEGSGLPTNNVILQGSAVRSTSPADLDLAVIIARSDVNSIIKKTYSKSITKNKNTIDISNYTESQLRSLQQEIDADTTRKIFNAQARDFSDRFRNQRLWPSDFPKLNVIIKNLNKSYGDLNITIQSTESIKNLKPSIKL